MTNLGKKIRMERVMNRKTRKSIIVPMDHGLTIGTVTGLDDMPNIINKISEGGANAVILHAGIAETGHRGSKPGVESYNDIGLIVHMSGSTALSPTANRKVLVCSVEQAIALGADAVSIHINIGSNTESEQLEILGETAQKCRKWGMPLLAMMYPRGPDIQDPKSAEAVNIAARAGAELGADMIKTYYTGDIENFRKITKGCPKPILVAGGPKMNTREELLQMIYDSVVEGGAMGISIGRNIFQDGDPKNLIKAIAKIIHEKYTVDEALSNTTFERGNTEKRAYMGSH